MFRPGSTIRHKITDYKTVIGKVIKQEKGQVTYTIEQTISRAARGQEMETAAGFLEAVTGAEEFILRDDDDGHYYIIPLHRATDFDAWLASDEAQDGIAPDWLGDAVNPNMLIFSEYRLQ